MSGFEIAAIVLFALAGGLFLFSWILFFSKNIAGEIRYLRNMDEDTPSGRRKDWGSTPFAKRFDKSAQGDAQPAGPESPAKKIAVASVTLDEAAVDISSGEVFATRDWTLPAGAAFTLTKDVTVCHSEREYLIRER